MKIQDWLRADTDHLILALVCTDIVNSTVLQRQLGDREYHVIRRLHFAQAKSLIEQWGGHEVKNSGDSFFAVFKTAIAAFNFAISLHDETGDPRVKIRAGVHVGTVRIEDDGDIFGTPANYINRVMSVAKEGGVMLSRDAKSQIEFEKAPEHRALRYENLVVLPGFEGRQQVSKAFTPGMITARRKRADGQSVISKIMVGSHDRPKEVPPPIQPPLARRATSPIEDKEPPVLRRPLKLSNRALLVEAAWALLRCKTPKNQALHDWTARIAARRGKATAVVALARKMAGIMYAIWRDGTEFNPDHLTGNVVTAAT
jgi:hypothetical protein